MPRVERCKRLPLSMNRPLGHLVPISKIQPNISSGMLKNSADVRRLLWGLSGLSGVFGSVKETGQTRQTE
jgi:hypothetical protein